MLVRTVSVGTRVGVCAPVRAGVLPPECVQNGTINMKSAYQIDVSLLPIQGHLTTRIYIYQYLYINAECFTTAIAVIFL